MIMKNEPEGN